MFTRLTNLTPVIKYWDRTPKSYKKPVSNDINRLILDNSLKQQVIDSGIKVEVYDTDEVTPLEELLIWSPKSGGTLHIEKAFFLKLLFLDRKVIISIALDIHRHYKAGTLKLGVGTVTWKNHRDYHTFSECMEAYRNGFHQVAMDRLASLPWFVDSRPSRNVGDTQVCHNNVLMRLFKISKGLEYAQ